MSERRTPIRALIRCLSVALLGNVLMAADYTVSTAGSDSAAGDAAHPWRTLQHAANVVQAGDTVMVLAGGYAGFDLTTSGTAGAPIVFQAQPGVSITSPEAGRGTDGIDLEGASYITIAGFTVNGVPRSGITSRLNNHVTIRGNSCDNNGTWGIFTSHSDDLLIQGNTTSNSHDQHGIYVSNACVNPVVRGNLSFGNHDLGLHLNGDLSSGGTGVISGALIDGNIFRDNATNGADGDGVINSTYRNNLIYNNGGNGISLFAIDGAQGPSGDTLVNNTILVPSTGRWGIAIQQGGTGNVVRNNILLNANTSHGSLNVDSPSGLTSDYNIVVDKMSPDYDTAISLAAWRTLTGQDQHSFFASAASLFVNAGANDYHLASGSTAIDTGTAASAPSTDFAGAARPQGAGFDIGAYEAPGSTANLPPTVSLTSPAAGATFTAPATITIAANAADSDGSIAKVEFYQGTTLLGSDTAAPYSFSWGSVAAGSYALTAKAYDNTGASTVSSAVSVTVNPPASSAPNAGFVSQSVPTSMTVGQPYQVSVTMSNTGNTTWSAGAGYKLGSQNAQDNTTWGGTRVLLGSGDSIAPGQSKTFAWTVTAPSSAGTYHFQWQMVQEGVQWFGASSTDVAVSVIAAAPSGTGTGLLGQYWSNQTGTFTGAPTISRTDATVDFDWGGGSPDTSISADHFTARWSGQVQAQYSETYTFFVTGDDGVRLWVNGQLLIDQWRDQSPTEYSGTIALSAGQKVDIKLEYFEDAGGAVARLAWSSPSTPKAIVPVSQLYPAAGSGLAATYFDNQDLTGASISRIDATVDFDWGTGSPDPAIGADTFSARWTGFIKPPASGIWSFATVSDDGARVWVNGQLLVDNWTDHSATVNGGAIQLTGGTLYPIRVEYYENGGDASMHLLWSGPATPVGSGAVAPASTAVPQDALYPALAVGGGADSAGGASRCGLGTGIALLAGLALALRRPQRRRG